VSDGLNPLINIIHHSNSLLKESSNLDESFNGLDTNYEHTDHLNLEPSILTDLKLNEVLRVDSRGIKQYDNINFAMFKESKENNLPLENNGYS
jgi:hypothetical protein